jgi:hypothetical protein
MFYLLIWGMPQTFGMQQNAWPLRGTSGEGIIHILDAVLSLVRSFRSLNGTLDPAAAPGHFSPE